MIFLFSGFGDSVDNSDCWQPIVEYIGNNRQINAEIVHIITFPLHYITTYKNVDVAPASGSGSAFYPTIYQINLF
jgi:hypothetical protein